MVWLEREHDKESDLEEQTKAFGLQENKLWKFHQLGNGLENACGSTMPIQFQEDAFSFVLQPHFGVELLEYLEYF